MANAFYRKGAQKILSAAINLSTDTIKAALRTLGQADVLVVATPTYKAAYTGLLKAVLDQAPSGWLKGKVVVPLQVAASDRHALAVEVHLRPVLTELGALVPQALFLNEASLPADVRQGLGIGDGLVRLSVGLEHVEDLWADIESGLEAAVGT